MTYYKGGVEFSWNSFFKMKSTACKKREPARTAIVRRNSHITEAYERHIEKKSWHLNPIAIAAIGFTILVFALISRLSCKMSTTEDSSTLEAPPLLIEKTLHKPQFETTDTIDTINLAPSKLDDNKNSSAVGPTKKHSILHQKINHIERLIKKRKYKTAMKLLRRLIRQHPSNAELHYQYARASFHRNKQSAAKALSHCHKAIELDPLNPTYNSLASAIKQRLNRSQKN